MFLQAACIGQLFVTPVKGFESHSLFWHRYVYSAQHSTGVRCTDRRGDRTLILFSPLDIVTCNTAGCQHIFGFYPSGMESPEKRTPCPSCGGLGRTVTQNLSGSLNMQSTMRFAAHPPGSKSNRRRFAWGMTGWEFSHALGRMVKKVSLFDKRGYRRLEHVEDPVTGKVLHDQDHPLTEHKGHGSDRAK